MYSKLEQGRLHNFFWGDKFLRQNKRQKKQQNPTILGQGAPSFEKQNSQKMVKPISYLARVSHRTTHHPCTTFNTAVATAMTLPGISRGLNDLYPPRGVTVLRVGDACLAAHGFQCLYHLSHGSLARLKAYTQFP